MKTLHAKHVGFFLAQNFLKLRLKENFGMKKPRFEEALGCHSEFGANRFCNPGEVTMNEKTALCKSVGFLFGTKVENRSQRS